MPCVASLVVCALPHYITQRGNYHHGDPVRPKIVRRTWPHPWSSPAAHLGEPDETELLDLPACRPECSPAKWRAQLRCPQDDDELRRLRPRTHTARHPASHRLMRKREYRLGRRLRPLPVGRPPGNAATARRPANK